MSASLGILSDFNVQTTILDVVEEILDGTLRTVRAHEMEEMAISYCTKRSSQYMMSIIEWYSLDCDAGEPDLEQRSSWLPDEEPEPAETDAWSRSAMPTRAGKEAPAEALGSTLDLPPGACPAARVSSKKGRAPSDKSSYVSDASNLGKMQDFDGIPPPSQPSRRTHVKQDVEIDQWTRAAQLRAKKEAAAAAELERVGQIRKDARGNDYVYDRQGKVVLVQNVDGEKLPAFYTTPAVALSQPAEAPPAPSPAPPRGPRNAGGKRSARGKPTPALDLMAGGQPLYKLPESEQPALMSSLTPQPGVTLREGSNTKQAVRAHDSAHISQREYLQLAHSRPAPRKTDAALPRPVEPAPQGPPRSPARVSSPKAVPALSAHERAELVQRSAGSAAAYMPPVQPKAGAQPQLALGHRARMPRERQLLAQMPLAEQRDSAAAGRADAPEGELLPRLALAPSQGSVLVNSAQPSQALAKDSAIRPVRGTFDRQRAPGTIMTANAELANSLFDFNTS